MGNILYNNRVRRKKKSLFHFNSLKPYYTLDTISLKEKIYTFCYCYQKKFKVSKDEMNWVLNLANNHRSEWIKLREDYRKDYREYELSKD